MGCARQGARLSGLLGACCGGLNREDACLGLTHSVAEEWPPLRGAQSRVRGCAAALRNHDHSQPSAPAWMQHARQRGGAAAKP